MFPVAPLDPKDVFKLAGTHRGEPVGIAGVKVGVGTAVIVPAACVPPAYFVAIIAVTVASFLGLFSVSCAASAVIAKALVSANPLPVGMDTGSIVGGVVMDAQPVKRMTSRREVDGFIFLFEARSS